MRDFNSLLGHLVRLSFSDARRTRKISYSDHNFFYRRSIVARIFMNGAKKRSHSFKGLRRQGARLDEIDFVNGTKKRVRPPWIYWARCLSLPRSLEFAVKFQPPLDRVSTNYRRETGKKMVFSKFSSKNKSIPTEKLVPRTDKKNTNDRAIEEKKKYKWLN